MSSKKLQSGLVKRSLAELEKEDFENTPVPDFIQQVESSDGEQDDDFINRESDDDAVQVDELKGFSTAISGILGRSVVAGSGRTAILAEKKDALEHIDMRREEEALRRQLNVQRKNALKVKQIHVEVDPMRKPLEKQLKGLATRGVVQLFNAVMHHRRKKIVEDEGKPKTSNGKKRGRPGSLLVKKENIVDFKNEPQVEDKKAKYYKKEKPVKRELAQ